MGYSQKSAHTIFSKIAKRYDLNNSLLSLGIHHLWKRDLVRCALAQLPQDGMLLDLCTGTGDILKLVGPNYKAVGVDFCNEMLEIAKLKVPAMHKLISADVLHVPMEDDTADCVTIAFGMRNLTDLKQGLAEIKRLLKEGGRLYILEFGRPQNKIFSVFFKFYSKYILPLVGGLIAGDRAAYSYLHKTSWEFPCADDFAEILRQEDFKHIEFKPLSFGIAYLYSAGI